MKQIYKIISWLCISNIFFTAEVARVEEFNRPKNSSQEEEAKKEQEQRMSQAVTEKSFVRSRKTYSKIERLLIDANNAKTTPPSRENKKTNNSSSYLNQDREKNEQAILDKAQEIYRQRHNDGHTTSSFFKTNIDHENAQAIYKSNERESVNLLYRDLYNIDPHLFKTYANTSISHKEEPRKLTSNDFVEFQENPTLLLIGTSTGNTKTNLITHQFISPLEQAIELEDKDDIAKIFNLLDDQNFMKKAEKLHVDISAKSLTQPLIDKYIDLLHNKGIDAASEYIQSLEDLEVPELTKTLNEQTTLLFLQWALNDNNIQDAKNIIKHAKKAKISSSFVADELAERYNYLLKQKGEQKATAFLHTVHALGNETLYTKLYYKLFPSAE